jgi:hypothetical protein
LIKLVAELKAENRLYSAKNHAVPLSPFAYQRVFMMQAAKH